MRNAELDDRGNLHLGRAFTRTSNAQITADLDGAHSGILIDAVPAPDATSKRVGFQLGDFYFGQDTGGTGTKYFGIVDASGNVLLTATAGQVRSVATNVRTINHQTGTTYTLVAADASSSALSPLLELDNGGAITLTVPNQTSVPLAAGAQVDLVQVGAGKVTLVGDTNVDLLAVSGLLSVAAQYSGLSLVKRNIFTGTITSTNTAPADGATVTIGSKVYTFKTTLTPTEGEVLINTTADAALLNLIRAINHSGTPNTDYKCAAAHPDVTAATSVSSHTFKITSIVDGTVSATPAPSASPASNMTWGAAQTQPNTWTVLGVTIA